MKDLIPSILLVLLIMFPVTLRAGTDTVKDISDEIICTCGCSNMILSTCQCGTADKMRADIGRKINEGATKEGIIREYVEQYGEKILAAPTKSGFNYVAWITPILSILTVGGLLVVFIRKWTYQQANDDEELEMYEEDEEMDELSSDDDTEDIDYNERLDRDLRDFG